MIKLRTPHQTYSLPTNGKELTLGNYLALQDWAQGDEHSSASLVACLSGIAKDDALQVAGKWERYFDFNSIVDTLNSLPNIEAPKSIDFFGEALERKPFGYLNAGQRVALRDLGEKLQLDKVLAICLAPQVYGKQWASNIELFAEELRGLLAVDAVPMAYFFLGSGVVMKSNGVSSLFLLMKIFFMQKMAGFKSIIFGRP